MPGNDVFLNTYDILIARPLVVICAVILTGLAIFNARAPSGSLLSIKGLMILIFITGLFIATIYSWRYFIWLYVGGAILQGFSFLVPPAAIEQKFFFSYFFLNFGSLKIYLADLFLLVALLVLIIRIPITINNSTRDNCTRDNLFNNWISRAISLFVVFGGLIGVMSVKTYGKSALGEARIVWYAIFFFTSVQYFKSTKRIMEFFRFFVFMTLIRSFFNFITVFISPAYLSYDRPFGSNGDAAYCAISFLLLITLGTHLIKNHSHRKIALLWLGIFPILITSRSTLLCIVLTLATYGFLNKKIRPKSIVIFTISSILFVAVSLYLIELVPQLNDLLGSRFLSLLNDYQNDPTGNWRLAGWLFALQSIIANPLLGIGFGGYAERYIDGQWITVSLHSAFLDYLYTMGLLGLLPFVGSLLLSLKLLRQTYIYTNDDVIKCFAISLFIVMLFYMMFIGLNAEMNNALTGTVMWTFLGMIPYITKNRPSAISEEVPYESI